MLVSIITVCLNNEDTITETLNSVLAQKYHHIEHILVDGKSTDGTLKIIKNYPFKNKVIISKKDSGPYQAMNRGIKKAKGDVIAILNADDIYNSNKTIQNIVNEIKKSPEDIGFFFSDVAYFNYKRYENINRIYKASFNKNDLQNGNMPPHPGTFIKKIIYKKYGFYDETFKIAGDYDFFLRNIYFNNLKFKILDTPSVRMRLGGLSTKNISVYISNTLEIMKSMKNAGVRYYFMKPFLRLPRKIHQFIILKEVNKWKKTFNLIRTDFYRKNLNSYFILLTNLKKLFYIKKNGFILSALNLAFLGYYEKGSIKKNNYLINWPDGIFSKFLSTNIKKIPGRKILDKIKIPKDITRFVILGNLNIKSQKFLEKRYEKKIHNIPLIYDNAENIFKKLKYKYSQKDLVLITLPTPKQEELANLILKKNSNVKAICIGASIAIQSGIEKQVPNYLSEFEFLWRLRYETRRRIKRLLISFYYFFKSVLITKKIQNIDIEIVK
jgi:glycosyltransferase involved in cell wall biosynthesis